MALPTPRTRILTVVLKWNLRIGSIHYTLCFSDVFPLISLGFGSTFSAAEESIVPQTSPGHMKNKYEVSSQASPFSVYEVLSSGVFGKQFAHIHAMQRKITRVETLSNQDS